MDMTSLFAALDTAAGGVIGKCYRWHRSLEFLNLDVGVNLLQLTVLLQSETPGTDHEDRGE